MATIRHRRKLGRELARIREQRGLSQEEVAEKLGWSRPTVGRVEGAQTKKIATAVRQLLDLYEVHGGERDRLLRLAASSGSKGWWESYIDVLVSGNYVALEDEATRIRTYHSQLIPGLLQIDPYTRAIIAATRSEPALVVARRAEARSLRRQLLTRTDAPSLHAVIDEAVLYQGIGGPAVMIPQLEHVMEAARRPNVDIQILPLGAGAHAGMEGRFVILSFDDDDPDVPYIESQAGSVYLEARAEIERVNVAWGDVVRHALSVEDSLQKLIDTIQDLRPAQRG